MKQKTIKKCQCGCGHEAQVLHVDLSDDTKYYLCRNCEIRFVETALLPKQFFALLKNGHETKEHMLHSDFYNEETGEALQPKFEEEEEEKQNQGNGLFSPGII